MSIKILLSDDHKIFREAVRSLLEKEKQMEIVAEVANGDSAVKLAQELTPDVVVMDIATDSRDGIDATRRIKTLCPLVKVLILSMHRDRKFVGGVLTAGASGYLTTDCTAQELTLAVRAVVAGETCISPAISKTLVEEYVGRVSRGDPLSSPVPKGRERDILQLVAEGKTSTQIASCLGMSIRTVECHRRNIKRKLDIHTTAELTKYAIRKGITSLES
ncbi:MAG: response regulator transcription factor [Thermodesulfobacteriota bacterium]|nr:response regulator transcription factor [Thermodesulfobacteriota bacterium]